MLGMWTFKCLLPRLVQTKVTPPKSQRHSMWPVKLVVKWFDHFGVWCFPRGQVSISWIADPMDFRMRSFWHFWPRSIPLWHGLNCAKPWRHPPSECRDGSSARLITEGLDTRSLGSMEHFLLFQMMAAKLLEKVLPLVVSGPQWNRMGNGEHEFHDKFSKWL
jgi:hypothetical protein